ncbi:rRNA-processing protein utp23 [Parachaetomium inaequale]|uniref:U three protein 23 n=1 Tax=Parachaetomium inaequale TaxID=2588326 RepID=A0AAN6PJL2_9PEZI|nr:rRNA-processing protein utp23 [Parachaetomium inaequale]
MGKRTKQYKKLMRAFEHLGFRQPYQLLVTSDVLLDTTKLDLVSLFEKTLSTKGLKPMITQCCIRALYAKNVGPNRDQAVVAAIDRAKTFERRRCGHLMDADPLPERECMLSVVDPKGKGENKFRYVVVTQDELLRDTLRSVVPTPLMYVRRSVMILEPMSSSSARVREREERSKFLEGIVRRPQKRKREDDESGDEHSGSEGEGGEGDGDGGSNADRPRTAGGEDKPKKKKKQYGRKGPNPLAVRKAKTTSEAGQKPRKPAAPSAEASTETKTKRKRRKKASGAEGGGESGGAEQAGHADTAPVEAAEA